MCRSLSFEDQIGNSDWGTLFGEAFLGKEGVGSDEKPVDL